jgi:hypothetical protein
MCLNVRQANDEQQSSATVNSSDIGAFRGQNGKAKGMEAIPCST